MERKNGAILLFEVVDFYGMGKWDLNFVVFE
jgi:hypothetical protein